ncbi:mRNA-degrading endonuclease toxin of MazEF toxin-antitoxin module [Loktanella ponticola]|uniref:mRNA-degrading endonuclease toxin of MazEF toxin-antitoxin module n=1 Tax=Yoonia ponticola TaxID=1524255 RepID=A0A7W9BNH4_9RHOB|nr:hypothetical protein [Yoonia ponticola]MBB5723661.1 mRNA-degrading endonuclease toxin of MazEF toxin-antitoxin module [Yoonia ponticola]
MTLLTPLTDKQATLASGDIVSFLFPSTEGDVTFEKKRPCLILEIDADNAEAVVAYGTASDTRANTGLEIRISRENDIAAASLSKPTRFVGTRCVRVSLSSTRFVKSAEGEVRIGQLPASLHARFEQVKNMRENPDLMIRKKRVRKPCRRYVAAPSNTSKVALETT